MQITTAAVAAERAERFSLRWKERERELTGEAGQVARDAARDVRALCDYVASAVDDVDDAPNDGKREAVQLYGPEGKARPGETVPHPPPVNQQGQARCRAVTHAGHRCRRPARDDAIFCGLHAARSDLLSTVPRPEEAP